MTIIVKPPQYDYRGLSISRYMVIPIYCPSLPLRAQQNLPGLVGGYKPAMSAAFTPKIMIVHITNLSRELG